MSPHVTWLYVPGDRPALYEKALQSGADAIVIDLEDAVALSAKDEARSSLAQWLTGLGEPPVPIWVRVNRGDFLAGDTAAAVAAGAEGIWLPKVDDASVLAELDERLRVLEQQHGRAPLSVSPIIETAAGVWNVREIAASARVAFLQLGEVDLAADLGVRPGPDGAALLWARSRIVAASAAAGLPAPLGAVSVEVADRAAFEADTRRLTGLGFHGRACIHPDQVNAARAALTPTETEVAWARDVIDRDARAGGAATVDAAGRMIDAAVVRNARRVLARVG